MSLRSFAGWNYRVLRYKDGTLGLHEVYYDAETGRPTSCTERDVGIVGDDLAEMHRVLDAMSKGLAAEILDYETFPAASPADADSSSQAVDLPTIARAVHAVLGWQPGWCADCEPISQRGDIDHHEATCGYWESVKALCALVGIPQRAEQETAEQLEGKPGYRRHRFGGKLDAALPFTSDGGRK